MVVAGSSGSHDHDHDHSHSHDGGEAGHGHLENLEPLTDAMSAETWQFAILFALLVLPTALTLLARVRLLAGAALVTAIIMATLDVVDGFIHAIGEGEWAATVLALVAVGLPATLAVMSHIPWLRSIAAPAAAAAQP